MSRKISEKDVVAFGTEAAAVNSRIHSIVRSWAVRQLAWVAYFSTGACQTNADEDSVCGGTCSTCKVGGDS